MVLVINTACTLLKNEKYEIWILDFFIVFQLFLNCRQEENFDAGASTTNLGNSILWKIQIREFVKP